jgi:MFS family permease
LNDIQWVVTAYTLAQTVSVPLFGYLADRFGTKWVYMISQRFQRLLIRMGVMCGGGNPPVWQTGRILFLVYLGSLYARRACQH